MVKPTSSGQACAKPKILGIDHLVLRCAHFEQTIAFYRDVLGCPVERVVEKLGLYQLRAGNALLDLVPVGSPLGGELPPEPAHQNMAHFCLCIEVAEWTGLRAYLAARGVDCELPQERYGAQGYGSSIYIEDPEGNVVELKAARP